MVEKLRKLDVEYDDKVYGNLIDPYEWNQNFKKIEEVFNQDAESIDGKFDDVSAGVSQNADDITRLKIQDEAIVASIKSHVADKENPHDVMAAQVPAGEIIAGGKTPIAAGSLEQQLTVIHDRKVDSASITEVEYSDKNALRLKPRGRDWVELSTSLMLDLSEGLFCMYVDGRGHLIAAVNNNVPAPPISISEDGHLIYTVY